MRSENLARITEGRPLSRGLGRSYGDSSLPASPDHEIVSTVLADRMLSFDEATGVLRAAAGLSLRHIYRSFLPRGWFVPVSRGRSWSRSGAWWPRTSMAKTITTRAASARTSSSAGKLRSAQSMRLLDSVAGERQQRAHAPALGAAL